MRLTIKTDEPASSGTYAVHFHFVNHIPMEVSTMINSSISQVGGPDKLTKEQKAALDKLINLTMTRETYCTVHIGDCKLSKRPCETPGAHTGLAKCNPIDNFVRWKGRKLSFTRAIASYPKQVRALLWDEYNAKYPPPPSRPMRKRTKDKEETYAGKEAVGGVQGGVAA